MSELRSGLSAPSATEPPAGLDHAGIDQSLRTLFGGSQAPSSGSQGQGPGQSSNVVPFPGSQGGQGGGSPAGGRPNASEMVNYLTEKGESPHVAQGIVNRLTVESGLDPGAVGDNGSSFGLAQWKDSRAVGLLKYGQQTGKNPYDWKTQLDYTRHEMDGPERGTRDRLRLATNPQEAQQIFTDAFERPAASREQLHQAARGSFNEPAQQFVGGLFEQLRASREQYDQQIKAAQEPRELERLLARRYLLDSQRPPQNAHAAWQQWSGVATALALFGGMFGRRHMTGALNAAAGMLEGANQADTQAYDRKYKEWKDHLDLGLKSIEMMNKEAREIISDAGGNYNRALSELNTLAAYHQLPGKYAHEEVQRQKDQLDLLKTHRELLQKQNADSDVRLSLEEKNRAWLEAHPEAHGVVPPDVRAQNHGQAEREYKGTGAAAGKSETKEISQTQPDGTVRSGAATRVGTQWFWAGTSDPVVGTFDFKSIGRPRSAPAEFIYAFKRENPNATSNEISHANAMFRADADAAVGASGKNIVALNTLADHLPLFEKYARALETGDVKVINRMLQSLSEETGHPEITNFKLAQEFIADETVKVLVSGSGAGALADREALKARLMASMSQAQFGGVADVVKDFVHGKLGALRQAYGRGDSKREEYFNNQILTPDARRLFDTPGPGASGGATSSAPQVPVARPEVGGQPVLRYDAQGNRVP
jgi:Phage tail lysozyme